MSDGQKQYQGIKDIAMQFSFMSLSAAAVRQYEYKEIFWTMYGLQPTYKRLSICSRKQEQ